MQLLEIVTCWRCDFFKPFNEIHSTFKGLCLKKNEEKYANDKNASFCNNFIFVGNQNLIVEIDRIKYLKER